MTKTSRQSPEQKATALLEELKIDKAPVPVERIAKHLGAVLRYEPFEGSADVSGMLFRDDTRTVIGVNATHAKTRQRFTIAHECGHLALHDGNMYVDARVNFRNAISGHGIDPEEIEANQFAAALLMPQPLVLGALRKALKNDASRDAGLVADELARVFEVSKQAMDIRLQNLGLIGEG